MDGAGNNGKITENVAYNGRMDVRMAEWRVRRIMVGGIVRSKEKSLSIFCWFFPYWKKIMYL